MKNKLIKNNGYGLLETVVAVGLFAFVMLLTLSIFQSVNQSQKSSIASQTIQENLRYVLEIMSKEIRQGVRSDSSCLAGATRRVYNRGTIGSNNNVLFFKKIKKDESGNAHEICVAYYLDNGRIRIEREDRYTTDLYSIDDYITPNDIIINSFNFDIFDNLITTLPESKFQPRVNLRIEAEIRSGQSMYKQPIFLQTSISSRTYGDNIYDD